MKKTLLFLSSLVISLSFTQCTDKKTTTDSTTEITTVSEQEVEEENTLIPENIYQDVPKYLFKYYEGTIDGKYPIAFVINKYDNTLYGFYFYKKNKINIDIIGNFENNQLFFTENTDDEKRERFELYFTDENNLQGRWIGQDKKYNVTLSQVAFPNDITEIQGIYNDSYTQKSKIKNHDNEVVIVDYFKNTWTIVQIKHSNPIIENKINKLIEEVVCFDNFTSIEQEKKYLKKEEAEMLKSINEDYSSHMPYFTDKNVVVGFNSNNILELVSSFSSWAGGTEHYGSKSILINTLTGNTLKFDDCFLPTAKPIILHLLKKELKQNYSTNDETLRDLKLDKMFGVTSKGITYSFDKYEVADGASGAPYIEIPFSELKDYIKTDGPFAIFKK